MSQQTYDVAEYDSEEERRQDPVGPPLENQESAATYIGRKIQQASGEYALMGGFALLLLGSERSTRDVDMVTTLKMKQIWSLIEGDTRHVCFEFQERTPLMLELAIRLIVPKAKLAADVIKIFVKTGPGYDNCQVSKAVEVDIALPGVKGTPADIRRATATVRGLSSLDVSHVLRAKMFHYADRQFRRDFEDIVFLLRHYTEPIQAGRRKLKKDDIEAFLCSEDIDAASRERYAKILLG